MDILLGEIVLMNSRTELYLHFLENKSMVCYNRNLFLVDVTYHWLTNQARRVDFLWVGNGFPLFPCVSSNYGYGKVLYGYNATTILTYFFPLICLSVCLSFLFVCLSVCLSYSYVCLSVLLICLSVLLICLSVSFPFCIHVFLSSIHSLIKKVF
jgi:hypothetical protein